jgi:cytochrome P450
MRQTDRVVSAPTMPGRLPVLGHLPHLAVKRSEFLQSAIGLGDVVKIYLGNKPIYIANSPDAIHEMLVTQSRSFGKGLVFQRVRPYLGNGLITSDGEFHRRQRRSLQPAFHRERIAEYITAMMQVADEQTSEWRPGEVVRIDRAMRRLSAAMLVATLFASQNATISKAVAAIAERVGDDLNVFIRGVFVYMLLPAWCAHVPTPGRRKFLTAADALRDLADSTVRQARENEADGQDLLSIMLAPPEDGSGGMSDQDARDELLTLLIAGVETTGTTLSWAIHVLGQHPDMADRMYAESTQNPPGFLPTAAALPYTTRFLQEVLRMYQPNWILMRRALETVRIGDVQLPEGAEVIYSPSALHRDPAYFDDPLNFDPDRWLKYPEGDLPRGSYIPFAAGNRKCIGDSFAWAEMLVALTSIVARWRLLPVEGHHVKPVADGQIHPNALPMRIQRRDTGESLWPPCPLLRRRSWRGRRSPSCAVLTGPGCPLTRAAPIPPPRSRCITPSPCRRPQPPGVPGRNVHRTVPAPRTRTGNGSGTCWPRWRPCMSRRATAPPAAAWTACSSAPAGR